MHFHRSAAGLVVQAPAKLNLFFEVLAKRPDGYHEIQTLVYPIDLCDTLYFSDDPGGQIRLTCEFGCGGGTEEGDRHLLCEAPGTDRRLVGRAPTGGWSPQKATFPFFLGDVPTGPENLVVRAVELLRRRAGVAHGAAMRLVKRIPSAAGLGGGSSDAAAALRAANIAWNLGWTGPRLAEIGAELGSDVPLFFADGPAVCQGRGEQVAAVAGLGRLDFVVVRPPAGLSTAAVYGVCRRADRPQPLRPLVEALARGDLAAAGRLLFNRLEEAALQLSPWVRRLLEELAGEDCLGYGMTGSGTCCFGLCRHARHARRIAGQLQARGLGAALAVGGYC
jgi:4-diphosphocytidyl-2-C-methyl-D-erythritol kinase